MGMFASRLNAFLAFIFTIVLTGISVSVPATAADLSGGCCGDLEERVSELEATAARKGNRAVSLQIYGQVNKALLIWDDGSDSDAFVVDNSTSSSRVGFLGETRMRPGWYAGYRMEIEFRDAPSEEVFPGGDEGTALDDLLLRHSYLYVEGERFGRVSLGQQSPATDDITIINLGAKMSDAALHYNNNFGLKLDFGAFLTTDRTWSYFAHTIDSLRGDFLRYDTPAIYGFVLSAAAGENDIWDVALRYSGNWERLQVAAGVGYMDAEEHDFEDLRGSFSILHKDTGLFLSGAGSMRHDDFAVIGDGDSHFYFAQFGLKQRFLPYGETTIYGEFGRYKDYAVGKLIKANLTDPDVFTTWGAISDSEVQRVGFGIEQAFDSAGLLLYAQYHMYQADIFGQPCETFGDPCEITETVQKLPVTDWNAAVIGARVQF
jgi:hypothetical protein